MAEMMVCGHIGPQGTTIQFNNYGKAELVGVIQAEKVVESALIPAIVCDMLNSPRLGRMAAFNKALHWQSLRRFSLF